MTNWIKNIIKQLSCNHSYDKPEKIDEWDNMDEYCNVLYYIQYKKNCKICNKNWEYTSY